MPLRISLPYIARVASTLALAWAAAAACVALHTPLPWMIGPLLATSLLSMAGAPTESWAPLRNGGQWAIGATLGLYFTPQVMALVASLWWAIGLGHCVGPGAGLAVWCLAVPAARAAHAWGARVDDAGHQLFFRGPSVQRPR